MRRVIVTIATTIGMLAVCSIAPAQAATRSFGDRVGDGPGGMDLTRVVVKNRTSKLILVAKVTNLRGSDQMGGVSFYLDTRKKRRGPEFLVAGGTAEGTDWNIFRTRRWKVVGQQPIFCDVGMRVDYKRDVVTFRVNKKCLGRYKKVRVSVLSSDYDLESSTLRKDWWSSRRAFTPWVKRG